MATASIAIWFKPLVCRSPACLIRTSFSITGRGATIHRKDCPNVLGIEDRERLVKVNWGEPKATYPIPVRIKAFDRDGLMKDVSTLIADEGINMPKVKVETNRNMAVFDLVLEVRDILQLSRILDRLENLPNVMEARRVRPG